jgi:hypothetical protein
MHYDIHCEGCKRRIGGCRCFGKNKTIRWVDKATCMYCKFEEQNDLLDRKSKKYRSTKRSEKA